MNAFVINYKCIPFFTAFRILNATLLTVNQLLVVLPLLVLRGTLQVFYKTRLGVFCFEANFFLFLGYF